MWFRCLGWLLHLGTFTEGGAVGKCRLTLHAVSRKQLAEVGRPPPLLTSYCKIRDLGQEFESVQLEVWFVNVLALSPCGRQNTACIKLRSSNDAAAKNTIEKIRIYFNSDSLETTAVVFDL